MKLTSCVFNALLDCLTERLPFQRSGRVGRTRRHMRGRVLEAAHENDVESLLCSPGSHAGGMHANG